MVVTRNPMIHGEALAPVAFQVPDFTCLFSRGKRLLGSKKTAAF
jgi:hypothetical protein